MKRIDRPSTMTTKHKGKKKKVKIRYITGVVFLLLIVVILGAVSLNTQAAPTGLTGVSLTSPEADDGMITGLTTDMEYKRSFEKDWTSCSETTLTGLAAGIYNVRIVAGEGSFASKSADVVVSAVTKVAMTIYEDPLISADVTNARGFTWYTVAASDSNSDLQILEKTSDTPDFGNPAVLSFTGTCSESDNARKTNESKEPEFVHKATATGLTEETTYYFRVGDSALNLWSETGTFTTAAADGAFTFLDLADPQVANLAEAEQAAGVFETAVETVPDAEFIAINGDFVNEGDVEYQWDWLLNSMNDVMLHYTIAPIAGNHESQKYAFINHFNICNAPDSATKTGAYYSFDYSGAHFVMLNTNENSMTYKGFSVAQIQWMKEDIEDAKAEGKWIIVVIHKGPYTTSSHATNTCFMAKNGIRNLIAPIFAELDVDLVLQGHDHIYARTKPIDEEGNTDDPAVITELCNGISVDYQVNPDGSIYVIPATAGPKVYYRNTDNDLPVGYYDLFDVADEVHSAIYGSDPSDNTKPMRGMVFNFSSISIDGDKLTVISYEIDFGGLLHDTEEPYIIDTFGIIRQ